MRIPLIACAGLLILGGCRKAEPFFSGDKTPVNAVPSPEAPATGAAETEAATPPATPATPSPAPPAASPSPGV